MYIIIRSEPQLWTVGTEDQQGTWHPIKDCSSPEEAMEWCNYLNGGSSTKPQPRNEGDGSQQDGRQLLNG